jgi:hypothetical protein
MHKLLPANGRSIEDFTGQSVKGDIAEALANATTKARLTLAAEAIEWKLLHLSGTTTATNTTVVATIKAKTSA